MLTKRKKKEVLAMPNRTKRKESVHQPDTKVPSLIRQIWSKERKKEPRKENPPKGE